jgi:putative endonuclease
MGWVYILRTADGAYYVGSTVDLERRVAEHEEGFGAGARV